MGLLKPLSDGEFKVMSVVWDEGGAVTARRVHEVLSSRDPSYERADTYQLIHRCIKKGALEREEPGFVCRALVGRDEMQVRETKKLLDKLFGGSPERLLAALVEPGAASQEEIDRLRSLVRDVYREDAPRLD